MQHTKTLRFCLHENVDVLLANSCFGLHNFPAATTEVPYLLVLPLLGGSGTVFAGWFSANPKFLGPSWAYQGYHLSVPQEIHSISWICLVLFGIDVWYLVSSSEGVRLWLTRIWVVFVSLQGELFVLRKSRICKTYFTLKIHYVPSNTSLELSQGDILTINIYNIPVVYLRYW